MMHNNKLLATCFAIISFIYYVKATSINYGISQQPITDVNQLMPKLCQNQSTICEGSFCIPGVKKCVCDLRMPVQFGRFCLRQVEIETKCFISSQCNHTIKDAVCIDTSSNIVLDGEISKSKLEQWQQLDDLRQRSHSTLVKEVPTTTSTPITQRPMFLVESDNRDEFVIESRDDVIYSNLRNSPYEINYNTPELLLQNHTRRRTNNSDKNHEQTVNPSNQTDGRKHNVGTEESALTSTTVTSGSSTLSTITTTESYYAISTTISNPSPAAESMSESMSRKKIVIKNPAWPPGICSCQNGYMFDSMLRKCLALSLADSHCQIDSDCKQISSTHCSPETKKCECDEPLIWNQSSIACVRSKPVVKTNPTSHNQNGYIENVLPPLILTKLLPDQTMLLLIFIIIVIIGTLIILRLIVKCFSSSESALVSPKSKKKKNTHSNLQSKSPYATLRRPEHKPNSDLANFTQATRGRILNYDFEQEDPIPDPGTRSKSPQHPNAGHNGDKMPDQNDKVSLVSRSHHTHIDNSEADADQLMELNDNISVGQMESSENKSDTSISAIPGPPPNQQPPYMLASAMRGQGSAIAAAAAAVANKRMQMAQKRNLDQQAPGRSANGNPVFL